MKIRRKVNAGKLIEDIRAGIPNAELVERHDLSPSSFSGHFKLVEKRFIDPRELAGRITRRKFPSRGGKDVGLRGNTLR